MTTVKIVTEVTDTDTAKRVIDAIAGAVAAPPAAAAASAASADQASADVAAGDQQTA